MAIFTCVYCVTDMVAAIFRGSSQPYARPVLWVSNAAYIGMPLIITLLWVKYIDSLFGRQAAFGQGEEVCFADAVRFGDMSARY